MGKLQAYMRENREALEGQTMTLDAFIADVNAAMGLVYKHAQVLGFLKLVNVRISNCGIDIVVTIPTRKTAPVAPAPPALNVIYVDDDDVPPRMH